MDVGLLDRAAGLVFLLLLFYALKPKKESKNRNLKKTESKKPKKTKNKKRRIPVLRRIRALFSLISPKAWP